MTRPRRISLPALCLLAPLILSAQPVARLTYGTYLSTPSPVAAAAASPVMIPSPVALDGLGNMVVAAPVLDRTATLLTKVSRDGHSRLFETVLEHASPAALLVDAAGNAYLAGTAATGFTPTSGAFQPFPGDGFLAKFNPAGALVWTSFLSATPTALALDALGLPYVTGYTDSAFVTTAGALKSDLGGATLCGSPRDVPLQCPDAVIAKVSADGAKLLYASYLGGSRTEHARGIQIDSTGAIWIAGDTQSLDFPVTGDALQPTLNRGQPVSDPHSIPSDAFIAVLKPDGSGLLYATYFGGTAGDIAYSLLLDGDGSYYVVGGTASADFPVSPGAFQTVANPENLNDPGFGDAFFARFNRTNTVRYASFYGTSEPESARVAALSRTGRLDLLDGSYPRRGCVPDIVLVSVDRESGQVLTTEGIHGVAFQTVSLVIDASGVDYIGGHANFNRDPFSVTPDALSQEGSTLLLRVDFARADTFLPVCLTNAANFTQSIVSAGSGPAVAPGEIISLFGYGLNGPGTRVLVNGLDVPVLYSDEHQINAAVPVAATVGTAELSVLSGGFSASYPIPVEPVFPGIFTDSGQAVAWNADGSVNSKSNPASLGSAISLFATGLGAVDDSGQVRIPFHVTFDAGPLLENTAAAVQSAKQAPGFPAGVYRIDVTVPLQADGPESWVRIDLDASLSALYATPAATIWIQRP